MTSIELVAHRGYQKRFPENTLLALAEAIRQGARFVETDVQLSADDVPVLYHDKNLRRISAQKGEIHQIPFHDLIAISAHEPKRFGDEFLHQRITPLADLAQLLIAHPQVHAFIEIKRCAIQAKGMETVYRQVTQLLTPVATQAILMSFSVPFMEYAKRQGWQRLGLVIERWHQVNSTKTRFIQPEFIFCDHNQLPKNGPLNLPGTELVIYEVDDPRLAIRLAQRGVRYLETFALIELREAIEEHLRAP